MRQLRQMRLPDREDILVELLYVAELGINETLDRTAAWVLRTRNGVAHQLGPPLPADRVALHTGEAELPLLLRAQAPPAGRGRCTYPMWSGIGCGGLK